MNTQPIRRLSDGRPQFTVRAHEPLSRKGGCWTFTVFDHARGVVVHGPTTLSQEAAEYCGRFSIPADVIAPLVSVDRVARQMEAAL